MKKSISFLLTLALLVVAAPAFAAMPNYVGTDYKQAPACTSLDHGVFEIVNGNTILSGCITGAAWDREAAHAAALQARGIHIAPGTTVVLKSGLVDLCSIWVTGGCTALPEDLK